MDTREGIVMPAVLLKPRIQCRHCDYQGRQGPLENQEYCKFPYPTWERKPPVIARTPQPPSPSFYIVNRY